MHVPRSNRMSFYFINESKIRCYNYLISLYICIGTINFREAYLIFLIDLIFINLIQSIDLEVKNGL